MASPIGAACLKDTGAQAGQESSEDPARDEGCLGVASISEDVMMGALGRAECGQVNGGLAARHQKARVRAVIPDPLVRNGLRAVRWSVPPNASLPGGGFLAAILTLRLVEHKPLVVPGCPSVPSGPLAALCGTAERHGEVSAAALTADQDVPEGGW